MMNIFFSFSFQFLKSSLLKMTNLWKVQISGLGKTLILTSVQLMLLGITSKVSVTYMWVHKISLIYLNFMLILVEMNGSVIYNWPYFDFFSPFDSFLRQKHLISSLYYFFARSCYILMELEVFFDFWIRKCRDSITAHVGHNFSREIIIKG